jgi:hypothetical protein
VGCCRWNLLYCTVLFLPVVSSRLFLYRSFGDEYFGALISFQQMLLQSIRNHRRHVLEKVRAAKFETNVRIRERVVVDSGIGNELIIF